MQIVSPWSCLVIALSSLLSTYLAITQIVRLCNKAIVWVCFLTLWMTLLLLPVQIIAALQIEGLIKSASLTHIAVFQSLILAATFCWKVLHHPSPPMGGAIPTSPEFPHQLPWYLRYSIVLLFGSYLLFALNLCTSFPDGFDALSYHIPVALRWLQDGSFAMLGSENFRFNLAGNAEILIALALATGKQWLVSLGSCLSAILLALSAYLLAKKLSSGQRPAAMAAALIVLSIPITQFQTFSAYVDISGTAFFLAAMALFCYRDEFNNISSVSPKPSMLGIAASALACGISVGTKPIFYLYAAVFVLAAGIILLRYQPAQRMSARRLILTAAIGILLPSGFWFWRAVQATGNPVYPLQVSLGKHVLFRGYAASEITPPGYADENFVHRRAEWLIYPWTEWNRNATPVPYTAGNGLGGAFAAFVPAGMVFAFYASLKQRGEGRARLLLLLGWMAVLIAWAGVMHRVPRFGLPLWVLACVLSTPSLVSLERVHAQWFGILLVLSIFTTCCISVVPPSHQLAQRLRSGNWTRSATYHYPSMIDELPPGSRVLNNTGDKQMNFSLAGKRLTNRVVPGWGPPPQKLTPEYISSEGINYIVETAPDDDSASPQLPSIPSSIDATEIFRSRQYGKVWIIWQVGKRS